MKKLSYLLFTALLLGITACSDDELDTDKSLINLEQKEQQTQENKTKFDEYLEKIYTQPYNIEYHYRLRGSDKDIKYTTTPASLEKSIEMANLIKYMCLDAYEKVAPKGFLRANFPKKITIVGSPAYDDNGNIVGGTAEGGMKIILYDVNNMDINKLDLLFTDYLRIIYHEFTHILHQKVDYSKSFKDVTSQDYLGGSWPTSVTKKRDESKDEFLARKDVETVQKGFVSGYARSDYNEDFVETLGYYLTYNDAQWTALLERAKVGGGDVKINTKLQIVRKYMLDVWKIDLDKLKEEIQTRASNLQNIDLTKIE